MPDGQTGALAPRDNGTYLERYCPNWLAAFCDRYDANERGCWIWRGAPSGKMGYGHISVGPRSDKMAIGAHRFSWLLHRGAIPSGLSVLHKCDVPLCVNPAHLFVGTQGDNVRDMARKGRNRNQNTGRTHCRRGHALVPENVNEWHGMRHCRTCQNQRRRRS